MDKRGNIAQKNGIIHKVGRERGRGRGRRKGRGMGWGVPSEIKPQSYVLKIIDAWTSLLENVRYYDVTKFMTKS